MGEQPEHLLHDLDGLLVVVGRKVEKLEGRLIGGRRVCGAKTLLEGAVLVGVGGHDEDVLDGLGHLLGKSSNDVGELALVVIFFNMKTCSAWANQTLGSSSQKGVSLTPIS